MPATGKLFLIVGASGVGKDTILDGARVRLRNDDRFVFAKRTITRAVSAQGEDFHGVSDGEFDRREAAGEFCVVWQAHGLRYGLGVDLIDCLQNGQHVLANVSRSAIGQIGEVWDDILIVEITAPSDVVAERLRNRGRESDADIEARLKRQASAFPDGLNVITISNASIPDLAIEQFVEAVASSLPPTLTVRRVPIDTWRDNICFLHEHCTAYDASAYLGASKVDIFNRQGSIRAKVNVVSDEGLLGPEEIGLSTTAFANLGLPERSRVMLERTPSPDSTSALRRKIAGHSLSPSQINLVVKDISEDRYSRREISAFLVSASRNLNLDELEHLTRSRAAHSMAMQWPYDMVADKHSMGGVPGSRITMIVIPIVAAHGMVIPKTSSRAITSAAGTADAMEVVARVDLSHDEVRNVVEKTGGCIAWNGNLNHSPVDDVMNSITRPLAIDSQKWSVASILSKKLAAGSTHVVIDIPYGTGTRTPSSEDAKIMAELFQALGTRLGLEVLAKTTDGSQPIGKGIGPALEVRDVYAILRCADDASKLLRDKALDFAGHILEWDPNVRPGKGRDRALKLLKSGAALRAFETIVDAQGRNEHQIGPGALVSEIRAAASGVITATDGRVLSGIARRAGAPFDKSAGVDLIAQVGHSVRAGDVLMRIHGSMDTELSTACEFAGQEIAFKIE